MVTIWVVPAIAQTTTTPPAYNVQQGDTGWELARQYYDDARLWKLIVNLNPKLAEPGRVFEKDGKIILILKPGEQLFGLDKLNIALPKAVAINEPEKPKEARVGQFSWSRFFIGFIFALALVAVSAYLLTGFKNRQDRRMSKEREREMRMDPVNSGPAFVPGGIPATEPERLRQFFEQQAIASFARRNPQLDRSLINVEQVGPIEEGMIHGEGEVGYLGQNDWRPRRIEPELDAYQGHYRYQDGTEEFLQCIQRCMNPVRFGGQVMRGFTFTIRRAVVPVPTPQAPAPQPAPHPAIAIQRIRVVADEAGNSTVAIGDRILTFEGGVHFTVDEATGAVTVSGSSFEMTIKPKRQKTANSRPKSQVAGQ